MLTSDQSPAAVDTPAEANEHKWMRDVRASVIATVSAALILWFGGSIRTSFSSVNDFPKWREEVEKWRTKAEQWQNQSSEWQTRADERSKFIERLVEQSQTRTEASYGEVRALKEQLAVINTRVEDLRDALRRVELTRHAALQLPAPKSLASLLKGAPLPGVRPADMSMSEFLSPPAVPLDMPPVGQTADITTDHAPYENFQGSDTSNSRATSDREEEEATHTTAWTQIRYTLGGIRVGSAPDDAPGGRRSLLHIPHH